jgi:hypothetical protein
VSQSFGYIPKSGIAGSNGRSMFSFLSSLQIFKTTVLLSDAMLGPYTSNQPNCPCPWKAEGKVGRGEKGLLGPVSFFLQSK